MYNAESFEAFNREKSSIDYSLDITQIQTWHKTSKVDSTQAAVSTISDQKKCLNWAGKAVNVNDINKMSLSSLQVCTVLPFLSYVFVKMNGEH